MTKHHAKSIISAVSNSRRFPIAPSGMQALEERGWVAPCPGPAGPVGRFGEAPMQWVLTDAGSAALHRIARK